MGKGALITVFAAIFSGLLMLYNSQVQSNETDLKENEKRSLEIARELAITGRKLILTGWVQGNGGVTGNPFAGDTLSRGGGKIWIKPGTWSNPGNDTLDFTVLASYNSAVHEIRSRYKWSGFGLNPVQMRVGAIHPDISGDAQLNFSNLVLDDQSLHDMEQVLVNDLSLVGDLSEYGLGTEETQNTLRTAFENINEYGLANSLLVVTEAERQVYEEQAGLFYPDQIQEQIETYVLANPAEHQTIENATALSGSFGIDDNMSVLTVGGDFNLTNDFNGKGILVVEGDLMVQPGVNFDWEGVILVNPPQEELSPQIDLSGNVTITGALVAMQDGVPNSGHMDVSTFRDMNGIWANSFGADNIEHGILNHTHNFTHHYGNRVVLHSDDPSEVSHEGSVRYNETLQNVPPGDSVFFEIYNYAAHGKGIIRIDRLSGDDVVQSAESGFDELIQEEGNVMRTKPLPVNELEHFDIAVTRLSSLKKMWDTGEPYDGCSATAADRTSGPHCVWSSFNRYGALTLRTYTRRGIGSEKLIYETSLYWHRRPEEEEEFEEEMSELATSLQSSDYGLTFKVGENVTINGDSGALLNLGAFSGLGDNLGVSNLGTWHRQWKANEEGNPLLALTP